MKHLITKISYLASFLVLAVPFVSPLPASANGNASLSASSVTAVKGLAVTVTISLDTAGTPVFAYQADLSYSTSFFSSASISMSSGSPFTVDPGAQDPDVASGGNIHFTRFYTTAKNHSGAVATITLQSNGTAGSTAISFKNICPSTAMTSNCSAAVGSGSTQLLGTVNSGTITLTEPVVAATSGAAASSSKGAKSKTKVAAAAPAATAVTPTTTETKNATKEKNADKTHKVVLMVLDQDEKPVKNAKVSLDGVSGVTGANGKVTLNGLDPVTASGMVYYDDQAVPINIKINSSDSIQASKVSIKINKSNSAVPIAIGTSIAMLLAVACFMFMKHGPGFLALKIKSGAKQTPVQQPIVPKAFKTLAVEPFKSPKPTYQPIVPEAQEMSKEPSSLHEKAMDPGTVVIPSQDNTGSYGRL